MDELDREVQDRISRRRMIKRLGAATAVAWTAPVLSTLGGTPAFAQYPTSCPQCVALGGTGADHCAGQPDCGAESTGNPCSCLRLRSGQPCGCHSCVFCDNPAITPCGTQPGAGACPPGWLCSLSCCSDPALTDDFVCVPACNGGDNPDPCTGLGARATGGRTSMG